MELEIVVRARGQHWYGGAAIIVPEPMVEAFEPLNTCDEPTMPFITGDVPIESQEVQRVLKVRTDAAELLSKALANQLLTEMKKLDTHNGYKHEK
ncbi:MAG: hypothetical protein GY941_23560 [Planctomycetes bacterium]|nr:hypothetical protein [Planctomycetota bacterium]